MRSTGKAKEIAILYSPIGMCSDVISQVLSRCYVSAKVNFTLVKAY